MQRARFRIRSRAAMGLLALLIAWLPGPGRAAGVCSGTILNPITMVCWKCVFPISIGPLRIGFGMEDTPTKPDLVCICPTTHFPWIRIGLGIGFWEPARMAEVVRSPGCSPMLGGVSLWPFLALAGTNRAEADEPREGFYQVHWYVYPLLAWMNLLTQVSCVTPEGFDVLYISEIDPLWDDDELAFLINPEAVLFANPIAQAACAGDCAAATTGFPLDALFWCAGCQGSMYPLAGSINPHVGGVPSSLLAVQRMAAKLHRMLIARDTSSKTAQCLKLPLPIIKKSQYKTQMVHPVPITFTAHPFGRTTTLWGAGREFPVAGEDWAYLIWRKHLCCAF